MIKPSILVSQQHQIMLVFFPRYLIKTQLQSMSLGQHCGVCVLLVCVCLGPVTQLGAWAHTSTQTPTPWLRSASILPEEECSIKTNHSIPCNTECLSAEKLHRSPRKNVTALTHGQTTDHREHTTCQVSPEPSSLHNLMMRNSYDFCDVTYIICILRPKVCFFLMVFSLLYKLAE